MHFHIEVESEEKARGILSKGGTISHYAFQSINFQNIASIPDCLSFKNCIFIGCRFSSEMRQRIDDSNTVLTSMPVPYNVFRTTLYSASSLYSGYDRNNKETLNECYDYRIYRHYLATGKRADDITETLARTLHDHSMSDALHDMLDNYRETDIVAIMGGHALLRTDPTFRQIVMISKVLTENGKLMTSGGGPGAMEATHLGAWMAGRSSTEVDTALDILMPHPSFKDPDWLATAFEVIERFPQEKFHSIGIPTWLYGHEPATPFATHIAKYFENSLREDGLLTIAKGGVIYTPGSAGTMQEIFQDAVQNHYLSFGYASPMVFLGVNYWTEQMPAYTLLHELQQKGRYRNLLLSITDSVDDIIQTITDFRQQP